MESIFLAKKISRLASEVKALDIKILDLRKFSSFTDFFVICGGSSNRQLRAVADKVMEELKKEGLRPVSKEGYEQGEWVLVDYADVVLHIMSESARQHYDLEGFWNRAPSLDLQGKKAQQKRKRKKSPPKLKKPFRKKISSKITSTSSKKKKK